MKCREKILQDDLAPKVNNVSTNKEVSYSKTVSPLIYIVVTLGYILLGTTWYSPTDVPSLVLKTPLLGYLTQLLIDDPNIISGVWWFIIIAHIFETCFAIRFCVKNKFKPSSTLLFFAQTLYLGGFSLRVLLKYRP